MRIYKQKGKKALCDNLDDEQKEHLKIEDKKSKKKKKKTKEQKTKDEKKKKKKTNQ